MKKKASDSNDFNMAEEIRKLLQEDNAMSGGAVLKALQEKFPKQSINASSCSVAYSGARRKLGLMSSVRRKRPTGRKFKPGRPGRAAAAAPVTAAPALPSLELLYAAKQLLQQCQGDAAAATAAIKQVAALQMS